MSGSGKAKRLLGGLAVAAGLAFGGSASAALVNGGFETGDFTGWTGTGNTTFNGVQCPGPGPTVFQGNCSAFFGPVGSAGGISQAITDLIAGDKYTLSFAFLPDGGNPSSFSATFTDSSGTQTLVNLTNPAASGPFLTYSFLLRPSSTTGTVAFNFRDDPGFLFLDGVTLQVPEPESLALIGAGLVGLFFTRRRKAAV